MNVLVVVPTYNERDNLPLLAAGVLEHEGFRLLVVDDGSPDGTGRSPIDWRPSIPGRVEVMHRTGPRGLGRSYIDGLQHALAEGTADFICQMDADLSHNPDYLPDLVAAAATHDLVIGSRYLNGVSVVNWPLHRIFLSAFANRYIRLVTSLLGERLHERLPLLAPRGAGAAADRERWCRTATRSSSRCSTKPSSAGFRIGEVPIIFVERRQGQSKLSSGVLIESLIMPWRLVFRGQRR